MWEKTPFSKEKAKKGKDSDALSVIGENKGAEIDFESRKISHLSTRECQRMLAGAVKGVEIRHALENLENHASLD